MLEAESELLIGIYLEKQMTFPHLFWHFQGSFLIFQGFFYTAELDVVFFSSEYFHGKDSTNIFPLDVEKYLLNFSFRRRKFLLKSKIFPFRRTLKMLKTS